MNERFRVAGPPPLTPEPCSLGWKDRHCCPLIGFPPLEERNALEPHAGPRDRAWSEFEFICAQCGDLKSQINADTSEPFLYKRATLVYDMHPRSCWRCSAFPPLCGPLARRRAVNRHLHYAFTRRAWPARALNSLPGAVSTVRTVRPLTSSDHAHTTVVSIRSA